jgi:hypothetical protein
MGIGSERTAGGGGAGIFIGGMGSTATPTTPPVTHCEVKHEIIQICIRQK